MALEDAMENVSLEDDIISEDEDDLVTTIYYEESHCECSRRAKCKTKLQELCMLQNGSNLFRKMFLWNQLYKQVLDNWK